jgi:ABC-2 type transport system ATP-binding protein
MTTAIQTEVRASTRTVIQAEGLRKSYRAHPALDGLDLTVHAGEVHGFLGPNGAGKSTTIRIRLGLARADAGSAAILGHDPWDDGPRIHHRLAYVPGDVDLWPGLTGGEVIDLLGRLRGGLDTARRDELVDRFGLDIRKRVRTYSTGNRQKVALVSAFSSRAELLVLDEPTRGLDPLMEAVFQECVREERRAGRTVLLSSHLLPEVEALCDRVTIVRAGRVVESGTLTELRHLTRTTVVAEVSSVPPALVTHPGVHDLEVEGSRATFQADEEALTAMLGILATVRVSSLVTRPPSLEDLFLRHYRTEAAQ